MRLDLEVNRDVGNGKVVVLCRGVCVSGWPDKLLSRGKITVRRKTTKYESIRYHSCI
jgi:hypothetical protein